MTNRVIVTFGEMLREEFLKPMGISQYQLAKAIKVSPTLISKIINNKTTLTPEMAYRFSLFFGNSFESWMNLKMFCDKQYIENKYRDRNKLGIIPFGKTKQFVNVR